MKGCAHRHLEAVLSTHLPLTAFMLLPRGTRPWDGIDSISHAFRNLAWIQMVTMAHPGLSSISLISFKVPNNSQVLIFSFATLKLYNTVLNIAQSCPTLYDPMDCSPPGSCVHWILQARILEWVAISSFRGFFWPRIESTSLASPALAGRFFTTVGTWIKINIQVKQRFLNCTCISCSRSKRHLHFIVTYEGSANGKYRL